MPRDYANYSAKPPGKKRYKKRSKKRSNDTSNKLWWVVAAVVVLFLIVLFISLHHHKSQKPLKQLQVVSIVKVAQKIKTSPKKIDVVADEVHFDFYTILPKEQVDVSQLSSVAGDSQDHYVLQVAMVKSLDDAKHVQDELNLLGLDVYIDQVTKKGVVWNRVNIGPYFSKKAAKADQKKLKANHIDSLMRHEK